MRAPASATKLLPVFPSSLSSVYMAYTEALTEPNIDIDKLTYEIFTILESEFLKLGSPSTKPPISGKVRILSIDAGGTALLAAASLARLESHLRDFSGDSSACISDYFDIAAGSGAGGLLAAMLFTRGPDGFPLFSAEEAFHFVAKKPKKGMLRRIFRRTSGRAGFRRLFGDTTLRDAVKPLLVSCYDVATGSPFMFSRADAVEADGYDFTVRDVCAATCSDGVVEVRSVDRKTRVVAVGGEAAMANPTAVAITHVLNNKREFPMVAGVEDLLVVSFGGEFSERVGKGGASLLSAAELVGIAGEGSADMVDQLVSMAFGHNKTNNYLRVQAKGLAYGKTAKFNEAAAAAAAALLERNVESLVFMGRKISEKTNGEKLEQFAGELVREHVRRLRSSVPMVAIKPAMTPPWSSTATTTTSSTRSSITTPSSPCFSSS